MANKRAPFFSLKRGKYIGEDLSTLGESLKGARPT